MIVAPKPPIFPAPPRASPRRADDRRAFAARAHAFGLLILLLFGGLASRLWYLQIAHGADFQAAAAANQARRIRTRAARGTIVDCHGVILAANRARYAVYATPDVLKDAVELSRLAALLGDMPDDLRQTILDSQQNPYDPLRVALDVPMTTVAKIEENRPFLPGVSAAPEPVRWYPRGSLAAHLLGTMGRINPDEFKARKAQKYFSDDFLGKTGVERQYEAWLHGAPGGIDVQIDARGRRVRTLQTADALSGGTVTLALDAGVQAAAERALKELNLPGAAVAISPQTGAVLALASAPTFDPNAFATGIMGKDWKPLMSNSGKPMIDRAVRAMYPPGSTFKPVVAAAGLQTGAMTTRSTAFSPGYYYLGRARFGDWRALGEVNFYSAIAMSCDVFFYIYGQKIGPDAMADYAKQFGMAEKTGIDLPGEDIGSVPSPAWKARRFGRYGPAYSQWFGGDTLHMSIGQGDVLATPLQMARVAATLANGGDVLRPYVVQSVSDTSTHKIVFQNTRKVIRHVAVSAPNMEEVRRAMRDCVTSGTGKIVMFPEVAVAGKTGSAQMHGSARTHGWFICFAPYDHPTIAIAAIVEHGGHGADTAGKVARAMLQSYFHLRHERETFSLKATKQADVAESNRLMLFELRHLETRSARHLEQLTQNYADQALPIWNRLGITPVGFWTSIIGANMPRFTYLLAWDDLNQRQTRWDAFLIEESQQESGQNIVHTTTNSILQATDYSPQPRRDPPAALLGGVYEMRTYAFPSEKHLEEASKWFREAGLPQNEKHGMFVMGIWTTVIGVAPRLTMMLVFENLSHRERAWASFYTDPAWPRLQDGLYPQGEPLIAATESCIMKGTEFSLWR